MPHFAANLIFDGYKFIKNAYVSVDNNGLVQYVSEENEALSEKQCMSFYNGLICPAFVNAHCHLELSDRPKIAGLKNSMSGFIEYMISSRNAKPNLDKIKLHDRLMFQNGISVVADISNTSVSLDIKKSSKIYYHTFIELFGLDSVNAKIIFDKGNVLKNMFVEAGLDANLSLHSFYAISNTLYKLVLESNQSLMSFHFLESQEEYELFAGRQNQLYMLMKSIYPMYSQLTENINELTGLITEFQNSKIIAVHNVFANEKLLNTNRLVYCLCPKSNINLHNRLPSPDFVKKIASDFIVGTDSLASNDKLCVLSELKILAKEYAFLGLSEILGAATINGAKALNCDDKYGSFEIGKQPGIILIEEIDLSNRQLLESSTIKRLV